MTLDSLVHAPETGDGTTAPVVALWSAPHRDLAQSLTARQARG